MLRGAHRSFQEQERQANDAKTILTELETGSYPRELHPLKPPHLGGTCPSHGRKSELGRVLVRPDAGHEKTPAVRVRRVTGQIAWILRVDCHMCSDLRGWRPTFRTAAPREAECR
eukprot:2831150-Pyramimonas_sp.AAC.1